jgi:hypothetical protein
MDDLISRQTAIDAMINSRSNADVTLVPGSYTNGWIDGRKLLLDELLQVVFELPSAQPKTGKWINGHWDGDSNFRIDGRGNCWFVRECSNCHEEIKGKPTNYCPNCGARMGKEGEEHE